MVFARTSGKQASTQAAQGNIVGKATYYRSGQGERIVKGLVVPRVVQTVLEGGTIKEVWKTAIVCVVDSHIHHIITRIHYCDLIHWNLIFHMR